MKVILISGKARSGKDYVAILTKIRLEKIGHKVLIIHYADALKTFCKEHLNWDGDKSTPEGREMLQNVGTEIVRNNYKDTWVDIVIALLRGFQSVYDYVIIPDTRFKNEINKPKKYFDCTTIRVCSSKINNLTKEQRRHSSETDLDHYGFDFVLENNYDDAIEAEVDKVVEKIIH